MAATAWRDEMDGMGRYGAAAPPQPRVFNVGPRQRMNVVSIALSLFLPWMFFSLIFAALSFNLHYQNIVLTYSIVLSGLLVVVVALASAAADGRKKAVLDPHGYPSWHSFVAVTLALAWIVAVACGHYNFGQNMRPFFDIMNLNIYTSVDPSRMRGQQLMDAGRVVFVEDARLDLRRSMGFRNVDTYCVAPITVSNATNDGAYATLANYDFWAVGVNCCSGSTADFHCGEFSNPRAHAGLRLIRDDQRAFFRLAVQQAEAAFKIQAVHPLFVYWMQDPIEEVRSFQDEGVKYFMLGMFSYFSFQLFLVICAVVCFCKLGQF